jgi:ubiquinone/menaquinone biosynthesis C-methylase UbiE
MTEGGQNKGFDDHSQALVFYPMFIHRFLRIFFHLLYHPFAFTYDFVAAAVSFGRWNEWVLNVLPFIEGNSILELGHGPGHLQNTLNQRGFRAVGLDESPQMGRIAKRRLGPASKLTRGQAQTLPFRDESFQTILSTFPSEYILDQRTLKEARRCLSGGGRLVVLPIGWPRNPFLKWLYRVSGESPAKLSETLKLGIKQPFSNAGFHTEIRMIEVKSGSLLIVIAERK